MFLTIYSYTRKFFDRLIYGVDTQAYSKLNDAISGNLLDRVKEIIEPLPQNKQYALITHRQEGGIVNPIVLAALNKQSDCLSYLLDKLTSEQLKSAVLMRGLYASKETSYNVLHQVTMNHGLSTYILHLLKPFSMSEQEQIITQKLSSSYDGTMGPSILESTIMQDNIGIVLLLLYHINEDERTLVSLKTLQQAYKLATENNRPKIATMVNDLIKKTPAPQEEQPNQNARPAILPQHQLARAASDNTVDYLPANSLSSRFSRLAS